MIKQKSPIPKKPHSLSAAMTLQKMADTIVFNYKHFPDWAPDGKTVRNMLSLILNRAGTELRKCRQKNYDLETSNIDLRIALDRIANNAPTGIARNDAIRLTDSVKVAQKALNDGYKCSDK